MMQPEMDSPRKQQVKGSWKMLRGRIREIWGNLQKDDLERFRGKKDQLVGYITFKTGQTRSRVKKRVERVAREINYRF